jgi:hypothetical protein
MGIEDQQTAFPLQFAGNIILSTFGLELWVCETELLMIVFC